MSLKAFHIFFIVMSALMCFGIGYFRGVVCLQNGDVAACAQALASGVAGLGLVYYVVHFIRKYRSLSYL
jgi:hypothetical protein